MTILYVDDDDDDRAIFCEALSPLNFNIHCITAAGGYEALNILKQQQVDIVFSDYRMPGMDGPAFLEGLNQLTIKKPKVYLYASLLLDFEKEQCRKLGALDCFEKPGNIKEITALVSKVVQSHL
jgi:CheY-like chemotaxis protein